MFLATGTNVDFMKENNHREDTNKHSAFDFNPMSTSGVAIPHNSSNSASRSKSDSAS